MYSADNNSNMIQALDPSGSIVLVNPLQRGSGYLFAGQLIIKMEDPSVLGVICVRCQSANLMLQFTA